MADPRFFNCKGPFSLADIAARCGATLVDPAHGLVTVEDVAPLHMADHIHLTFIDNRKYRDQFKTTQAAACLMRPEMAAIAPPNVIPLLTSTPYKAYALAAQMFYPPDMPVAMISDRAIIDPTAQIGVGCRIEANAVIGAHVQLGHGCWIEANAVIGDQVTMGKGCRVGTCASISHAILGDHVRLYPGARVGQDGFGFAIDPQGFVKVPQLGRAIIGDHVEIGANSCIDRGAGPDTVIGMGTWIDNLVQIGHNVQIGRGCILVAQVGVAGSTVVEDFVALGGQVGVTGHLRIGKGAQIAAQSGVITDIPAGATMMGYPALPKTQFMRHIAYLNRAIKRGTNAVTPQDDAA